MKYLQGVLTFISICFFSAAVSAHYDLINASDLEKINKQFPPEVSQRFNSWDKLLLESHNKTIKEKLILVNQFFNQMKWVEDKKLWHKKDYWATPIESLIRNAGDCEDFSIAKYFTLRALKVPTDSLKITYVKILQTGESHMVLAYYESPHSDPFILDNINKNIMYYSKRKDIQINFSFNDNGLWLANTDHDKPVDDSQNIMLWADLIKRMKNEKI